MARVILTSPPIATARLVVDTDFAQLCFQVASRISHHTTCRYARLRVGSLIHDSGRDAPRRSGGELGAAQSRCTGGVFGRFLSAPFRQPAVLYLGRGAE